MHFNNEELSKLILKANKKPFILNVLSKIPINELRIKLLLSILQV